MEYVLYIVAAAMIGAGVSIVADLKGRNAGPWFFYGFFVPITALIHVFGMAPTLYVERRRQAEGQRTRCSHCFEMVDDRAPICPYCRLDPFPEKRT